MSKTDRPSDARYFVVRALCGAGIAFGFVGIYTYDKLGEIFTPTIGLVLNILILVTGALIGMATGYPRKQPPTADPWSTQTDDEAQT